MKSYWHVIMIRLEGYQSVLRRDPGNSGDSGEATHRRCWRLPHPFYGWISIPAASGDDDQKWYDANQSLSAFCSEKGPRNHLWRQVSGRLLSMYSTGSEFSHCLGRYHHEVHR